MISARWLASFVFLLASAMPTRAQEPAPPRQSRSHMDVALGFTDFRLDEFEGRIGYAWQARAGFYWNKHLKTEVDSTWLGTNGRQVGREAHGVVTVVYGSAVIVTPSSHDVVDLYRNTGVHSWSLAQVYQFESGWRRFRPYIGAAVSVDTQTETLLREDLVIQGPLSAANRGYYDRSGILVTDTDPFPTSFPGPKTTTHVYGSARAGFKLMIGHYQRAFLLVEAQARSRMGPLTVGFGVDPF